MPRPSSGWVIVFGAIVASGILLLSPAASAISPSFNNCRNVNKSTLRSSIGAEWKSLSQQGLNNSTLPTISNATHTAFHAWTKICVLPAAVGANNHHGVAFSISMGLYVPPSGKGKAYLVYEWDWHSNGTASQIYWQVNLWNDIIKGPFK